MVLAWPSKVFLQVLRFFLNPSAKTNFFFPTGIQWKKSHSVKSAGNALSIFVQSTAKLTCANVLCTINTVCKMINGKPVCLSCPKACAEIYKPVCGSDKVTYSNKCEMERAGCKKGIVLTVAHNRPCGSE